MDRRRSALLAVLVAALVVLLARPVAAASGPDPRMGEQWGLIDIKAPQTWSQGIGDGIGVAVVSTGIAAHEDLDAKVGTGFDATGANDPRADTGGRGTHLAGIVGAATGNAIGIAGVAPAARLLAYKAYEDTSADDRFVEALDRAARSAKVVLVDIPADYSGSREALRQGLQTAGQQASVVVGAQSGLSLEGLPVLAVAASSRSGGSAGGSVDARGVAAPGQGILSTSAASTLPGSSRYDEQSGTGQAAAHVAGAVAILRGLGATATQAADVLRSTARKGGSAALGAGVIDVLAATNAYRGPVTPKPAPTTTTTKKAAAAPTTVKAKAAISTTPSSAVMPSGGPVFDEETELGEGQEEAVVPPGAEEFGDAEERSGTTILTGGRERPWVPLTVGFGLLFSVGSAMSLTFRRLGAEPL